MTVLQEKSFSQNKMPQTTLNEENKNDQKPHHPKQHC